MSRRWGPLAILAAAAAGLALWPVPVVVIGATDRVLWMGRAAPAVPLRLEYLHSVERTPVVEVYEAGAGGLRFMRMEFVSQGAGLPSSGYVREGGRFVLRAERPLDVLTLRVSEVARPRLIVPRRVLDLVALAGDGGTVQIAVRRRPRLIAPRPMLY